MEYINRTETNEAGVNAASPYFGIAYRTRRHRKQCGILTRFLLGPQGVYIFSVTRMKRDQRATFN